MQPEEAIDAPPGLEEYVKATMDELKEINLVTAEDPRPTYVSTLLTSEKEAEYVSLLIEFRDVFAWMYSEMPGLNPKVAVHHLAIKKGSRLVKDLNHACLKDDFPLPIPKLMIDATTGHEALTFMDGSSSIRTAQGYQLKLNPLKCTFEVTSGKFRGLVVRRQGIEIEQAKIDVIMALAEPRNIHELKSLQGKLAYLCSTHTKKELILYIAAQDQSIGALLAQEDNEGKEN
ncbi:hypothetical protein LIER_03238 [Lithospermum erythrorhizon]|uniref:Reverse transcriptase/retrotransposon-derived protein RNase H-like domain-containing protein n=1 Tax=Lithospermum erythrorhizon TaxID=34254 RepID=A0AAV3NSW1_LITER